MKIYLTIPYVILLVFILSISGCKASEVISDGNENKSDESVIQGSDESQQGQTPETTVLESVETISEQQEKELLEAFNTMLENKAKPSELIKSIDDNIFKVSAKAAATMIEKFESDSKIYEQKYTSLLFEGDFQEILAADQTGDISRNELGVLVEDLAESDTRDLLKEIYDGGFKLVSLEGSYYPIIDYEFLKKYSGFLPGDFKEYLDIMAVQSNNVYSRDAGIMISWEELAGRTLSAEAYLVKYPSKNNRRITVANLYMSYLRSYLFGENNTPNRDYNSNKVLDEVIASYENTAEDHQDTETGKILKDYLKFLSDNDFVIGEDMFETINDYLKIPVKAFGLDSSELVKKQVQNMYYTSDISSYGYVLVVDGSYREKYDVESAMELILSIPEQYITVGDLNADGINDAATILVADPGGSGTFYYLHTVINGYSYFYDAAADTLGDRIKIESIKINEGDINIDMVIHKDEDPLCCPTDKVNRVYRFKDNQLFKLINNDAVVYKITDEYVEVLIGDALLQIMLEEL